jgi:protein-S-isoprenylcysteine O-methyltransferase Ste14|tara:strand:- start:985 stop:1356 length:372 start_codon:yes stop_codon:yes gene_type:complete
MKTAIILIKIVLISSFLIYGFSMLIKPHSVLSMDMRWVKYFEPWMIKSISILEILGAVGMLLPLMIKNISYKISSYSLFLLTFIMLGAVITHCIIIDNNFVPSIILFLLCISLLYLNHKNKNA